MPKTANRCGKLQNFFGICKFFTEIYEFLLKFAMIWLDLAKSHQIWSRSRQIWLDLAGFGRISHIALVGSSGSSFGEGNPPLDQLVPVLENGDPPLTDWSFGLGKNWVDIEWFGWVSGSNRVWIALILCYIWHLILLLWFVITRIYWTSNRPFIQVTYSVRLIVV